VSRAAGRGGFTRSPALNRVTVPQERPPQGNGVGLGRGLDLVTAATWSYQIIPSGGGPTCNRLFVFSGDKLKSQKHDRWCD